MLAVPSHPGNSRRSFTLGTRATIASPAVRTGDLQCGLGTAAKVAKGAVADASKCDVKFTAKWDDAETDGDGSCPDHVADSAAMKSIGCVFQPGPGMVKRVLHAIPTTCDADDSDNGCLLGAFPRRACACGVP